MERHVYLGVTNKEFTNLKPKQESFWCVYKNSNIKKNDLLVLYRSKIGINQIYEVIAYPSKNSEFDCKLRNMVTIATRLLVNIANPISLDILKKDKTFSISGPVRKNFQSTIFSLSEDEANSLFTLIIKYNKNIESKYKITLLAPQLK